MSKLAINHGKEKSTSLDAYPKLLGWLFWKVGIPFLFCSIAVLFCLQFVVLLVWPGIELSFFGAVEQVWSLAASDFDNRFSCVPDVWESGSPQSVIVASLFIFSMGFWAMSTSVLAIVAGGIGKPLHVYVGFVCSLFPLLLMILIIPAPCISLGWFFYGGEAYFSASRISPVVILGHPLLYLVLVLILHFSNKFPDTAVRPDE